MFFISPLDGKDYCNLLYKVRLNIIFISEIDGVSEAFVIVVGWLL
jgi:hypothetical protein